MKLGRTTNEVCFPPPRTKTDIQHLQVSQRVIYFLTKPAEEILDLHWQEGNWQGKTNWLTLLITEGAKHREANTVRRFSNLFFMLCAGCSTNMAAQFRSTSPHRTEDSWKPRNTWAYFRLFGNLTVSSILSDLGQLSNVLKSHKHVDRN